MEAPGLLLAFAAGLLSFLSPCVLPMIPSYLGFVGGTTAGELAEGRSGGGRMLRGSLLFSAGFTLVFIAMGLFLRGLLGAAGAGRGTVSVVAGAVVLVFGAAMAFDVLKFLGKERKLIGRVEKRGGLGAFIFGVAFAAGWSPCLGPILGSILALSSAQGRVLEAGLLLLAYSAGLALPFVLSGLLFSRLKPLLDWLKARALLVRRASGVLLILVGLAMIFLTLDGLNSAIFSFGYDLSLYADGEPLGAKLIAIGVYIVLAALLLLPCVLKRRGPGWARIALLALLALLAVLEALGVLTLFKAMEAWGSLAFV